jgi:hypothetical protein
VEVGDGGTGDRTLGLAAVIIARRCPGRVALALPALLLSLPGCADLGAIAGAATGAASGTGSANPALGYAVGIGTKAAVDALVHHIARSRRRAEQDQIVAAVGTLPVGQSTPWRIRHAIPIGDAHGDVTVVRDIPNPLAPCKEVVFTVLAGDRPDSRRGYYATTACRHGAQWKWALAEPATPRWGVLQ